MAESAAKEAGNAGGMREYFSDDWNIVYQGDVLTVLRTMEDSSVQCCVTSPPYWAMRDYGLAPNVYGGRETCAHDFGPETSLHRGGPAGDFLRVRNRQSRNLVADINTGAFCSLCGAWRGNLGHEPTPDLFIKHMVLIFGELKRVLRDDGTLWLNMGDTYNNDSPGMKKYSVKKAHCGNYKRKDLIGIPWMLAFALQSDGWYLRSDIIWHKPNPMPESAKDRPVKAHEYLFLLSKCRKYYYNAAAIKERASENTHSRGDGMHKKLHVPSGWDTSSGSHTKLMGRYRAKQNESFAKATMEKVEYRNKRSVWTVPVFPYQDAHFATFPPDLIKPCILAGCPPGSVVLDPFAGSGTTLYVAKELSRKSIGIEIKEEYCSLLLQRIRQGVLNLAI